MQAKPKISIITVTYNAEKVLERTIQSVTAQHYPDYEYIIVDGNSADGTKAIIEKYRESITKYLSEPDSGLYDAMNKGIDMAEGGYIWFINAGDQLYDDNTLSDLFAKEGEADVYYSDTLVVDQSGNEIGLLSKLTHNKAPENLRWKDMKRGMVVCHQSFIVRRNIAPYFDLSYKYSSDIDWVIYCLKDAETIVHHHRILARFMRAGLSKQHLKPAMQERYHILRKHFGFFPNLLNHFIMMIRYLTKGRKSKV